MQNETNYLFTNLGDSGLVCAQEVGTAEKFLGRRLVPGLPLQSRLWSNLNGFDDEDSLTISQDATSRYIMVYMIYG